MIRRWAAWFLLASPLVAAPPDVLYLLPAGGQIGTSPELTIGGKLKPWDQARVWFNHPGITAKPAKEGKIEVVIAKDVPAGVYAFRLHNKEGVSPIRLFVVGTDPELMESEPNNERGQAMTVPSLPVVVNGQLNPNGDLDTIAVALKGGQVIYARLACHQLDAPVDPLLHVLTPEGQELAFQHDGDGLDPWLRFAAPKTGTYLFRVAGFQHPPASRHTFIGKQEVVYRLHLTLDEPPKPKGKPKIGPQKLVAGSMVGVLSQKEGQVMSFEAKKGDVWHFQVRATEFRTPIDAVLRVAAADGKGKPVEADDRHKNQPDPQLDWTAPSDGAFELTVFDRTGTHGSKLVYQLDAERREPGWTLYTESQSAALAPGGSAKLAFTAKRTGGFKPAIHLLALDLPEDVEAGSPAVPSKGGAVSLTLRAGEKAKPWSGPIRIVALTADTEPVRREPVPVRIKARTTDWENLALQQVGSVWLTVQSKPETK